MKHPFAYVQSPSFTVLAEMDRVGVDFCIDVHGDETLPYNFLSGSEGLPKWGPRLKHLQDKFGEEYKKVSLLSVDCFVFLMVMHVTLPLAESCVFRLPLSASIFC